MKKLLLIAIASLTFTASAHAESCTTNQTPYCQCVRQQAHAIAVVQKRPDQIYVGTPKFNALVGQMHRRCVKYCVPGQTCGVQ